MSAARRVPCARPSALCVLALLTGVGGAVAETSPWYVGASQTFTHESNVYRLTSGAALPAGLSKSDTVSTTALLAGLDQPIGRQRVYGSASLRANRFRDNKQLDNEGYGLNLGLDWETVNNVSGNVDLRANRSLARFDTDTELGLLTRRNIESSEQLAATVRVGVVTRMTAEAGLSYGQVAYSAPEYDRRENEQTTATVGLRYRPASAFTYGAGLRHVRGSNPRFRALPGGGFQGDDYKRDGVDLTLGWDPGGASRIDARVNFGRTRYDEATERDFSGVTGNLAWVWRPGARLRLETRLVRDTGQSTYYTENLFVDGVTDISRTTTALRLRADYALTAKIALNARAAYVDRDLVRTLPDNPLLPPRARGNDETTELALGATWDPLRSVRVGCDLAHEQRSADRVLSLPYKASRIGCYGQIFLR